MKKLFIIIFIIFSIKTFSQNNGIGFRLGDPSGITFKRYTGGNAWEINIGRTYIFDHNTWYYDKFVNWYDKKHFNYTAHDYESFNHITAPICLQIHYIFQKPIKEADSEYGKLEWYFGFGGQLRYQSYSFDYRYKIAGDPNWYYDKGSVTDFNIGVDGTAGIEYKFSKAPITAFLDFTLAMELYNEPFNFWGQCGIGGRYNF